MYAQPYVFVQVFVGGGKFALCGREMERDEPDDGVVSRFSRAFSFRPPFAFVFAFARYYVGLKQPLLTPGRTKRNSRYICMHLQREQPKSIPRKQTDLSSCLPYAYRTLRYDPFAHTCIPPRIWLFYVCRASPGCWWLMIFMMNNTPRGEQQVFI